MIEFYDILTGLGIGVFSVLISSYIIIWYLKKQIKLEEMLLEAVDIVLSNVNTDENMQKNLYTIGALIGNGVGSGAGLRQSAKSGGKLTLNNLIAEIASGWIQKSINQPQTVTPNTNPVNGLVKDKFFNT